ncbi:RHS repeat domain-containing protein [Gracilimonas sediminicola]|uniref:RHS repeat domain-containing protein n=1 Tax=Gracilimonas sediminicola TaxID=2952158 RepID=UPI0038D3F88C
MNLTFKSILGVLLIIVCFSADLFSRQIYDLNKHVEQPELTSFSEYDKPTVDGQGNLNISITLGTIPGRGLDFPITLSYQSGIKVLQPSSWIGLGWNFNPGSITRSPSIGPTNANNLGPYDSGNLNGVDVFDPSGNNRAPDKFIISLPGKGSTEMVQIKEPSYVSHTTPQYQTGEFLTLEHKAWKIEYRMAQLTIDGIKTGMRTAENSGSYDSKVHKQDFSKFLITTEDGTRYLFGAPTLSYVDVPYHDSSNSSNYIKRQDYVSKWRLLAIMGSDYIHDPWVEPSDSESGVWVKFEYGAVYTDSDYPNELSFRQTQYLEEISTPLGSATFNTASRIEPMLQEWEKDPTYHANDTQRRLTQVKFFNSGLVKTVDLVQENTFNPMPNGTSGKGRMKLKALEIKGADGGSLPGYDFDYVANPDVSWPYGEYYHEMVTCMDEFGYINFSELGWVNNNYSGACSSQYNTTPSNANSGAESWSLSSITYPTGLIDLIEYETRSIKGSTELDYYERQELQPTSYKPDFNATASEDVYVAGPHVSVITRNSGMYPFSSTEHYREEYSYGDGTMLSGIPDGYFRRMLGTSSSNRLFAGSNSEPTINYGRVTIDYYEAGDINGTNSWVATLRNFFRISVPKTILFYRNAVQCPDPVMLAQNDMTSTPTCTAGFIWTGNEDWTTGRNKGSYHVARGTDSYPLTEDISYVTSHAGTSDEGLTNHIWTLTENQHPYTEVVKSIGLNQQAIRLNSKISKDGEKYRQVLYVYDEATNLIKQERQVAGTGLFKVKELKRAYTEYTPMEDKNMLSQIARVNEGYEDNGTITWKRGKVTTWKDTGIPTDPLLWKPWKEFSWKSDQPVTGNTVGFNAWSSGNTPSGWILDKEMTHYDLHGNLLELTLPNSTTVDYNYGFNSSKLTSVHLTEGVASSPTTLSVNLWYNNDFIKISRLMDQSGVNTYYEYDEHGRLISVKNHNQKLVKSYQYDYGLDFNYSEYFTLNRIIETTYTNPSDTSENVKSYKYYDGMSRLKQTVTEANGGYIVGQNDYGKRGFIEKQWNLYLDQNVNNGEFVTPSNARSRATQYYKSKLGLSYNPHPYNKKEYYGLSVPKVMNEYPAWTNVESNLQYNFAQDTVSGVSIKFIETIDEEGNKTKVFKNYLGQEVRKIVAENTSIEMTTDFEYDEVGNLVKSISPRGLETTYEYNTLGQLTQKSLPDQDANVDYRYDKLGNLRFEQDANHKSQKNDLSTSISGGTYISKTLTVTTDGELELDYCWVDLFLGNYYITVEDADTGVDIDTKTLSSESGCQGPFRYEVDPGNYRFIGQAQDPGDIVTFQGTFAFDSYDVYKYTKYDRLGRPIETGEYSGGVSFASANPDNEDFPTSGHQASIKYYYDGDHTPFSSTYSPSNADGKLTKVSYRDLSTTSTNSWGHDWFSYNNLGKIEWKISEPYGLSTHKIIKYNYDLLGRLTRLDYQPTVSFERFITWQEYDAYGRLEYVYTDTDTNISGRQKEIQFVYNPDGTVEQKKFGNSTVQIQDMGYTIRGWLEKVNNTSSIGSDKFAMKLSYTANGNISQQQWKQPAKNSNLATYNYSYDAANRLINANFSGSGYSSSAFDVTNITYDDNGNLKQYIRRDQNGSVGTTGYMVFSIESGSNKINYSNDQVLYEQFDFSYDANGNMQKNDLNGLESAQYDWRNLPSILMANSSTLYYAYNPDGKRVRKRVGSTDVHYVRGIDGQVLAVYNNDNLEYHNVFAGSEMVGSYDRSQRRYFLKDHLGSIRTTVDQYGNVDGYDDYYPFGKIMPGRSSNSANPADDFKYTGHERDDEANITLDYMLARNYDPEIGRFLQVDPMHSERAWVSSYNYAQNNPLIRTDPTGMLDDIFLNSETNEYSIIRTDDEHDVLYVDGKVAGATDVSFWEDGASNIYDSYTNYFMENSWAISDDNWLGNFNRAERMEVKQGIFNARMAMGQHSALITMTKMGAAGAGAISTLGVGSAGIGFALGSRSATSLFNLGTNTGTVSSLLGASESFLSGDTKAGALKLGVGIGGFGTGYRTIRTATMLDGYERGVATFGVGFSETIFNNQ